MPSDSIFTRRRMGLDNNVWIIMLACILLCAGLLGYTAANHDNEKPCIPSVDIFVNGRINTDNILIIPGQAMTFRSSVAAGNTVVWDFDDQTKPDEGFSTVHSFQREGWFTIKATVNDRCTYYKKVNVRKAPEEVLDSSGNTVVNIIGKDEATVGEHLVFSTTLPASSYEWFLENINTPPKKGKEATFTFTRQQTYTLVLRLDHDNKRRFTKNILVTKIYDPTDGSLGPVKQLIPVVRPREDTEVVVPKDTTSKIHVEPVKKKYKYVSDEILKTYIQSVVCKEMKPEQFDDYLCLGVATPVIVNAKERKPFSQVCSEIQDKKIKIESVKTTRDSENCVVNIIVEYDKRWILGRNPCRN